MCEEERRHDPVPEELHDRATVGFDGRVQRPVVAVHQPAGGLRVEPLVECRRSDQVGEHDRDHLARYGGVGGAGCVAKSRAFSSIVSMKR